MSLQLGVYGGSFNPIHWGHLHVALLAREAAGLDRVLFVPAARPPHKPDGSLAAASHRVAMIELALADEPHTAISTIELAEGGPRYTAVTLEALQEQHPQARLHFIMGLDSLIELPGWRDPDRLLDRFSVIAVDRPGCAVDAVPRGVTARARVVTGNPLAISASAIRERVSRDLSIRHLVPASVADYIGSRSLYHKESG